MKKVSTDELLKISAFSAAVDDMINGKFILADVKISKVIDLIRSSSEMYRYVSECLIGFDYSKELGRAEYKNSLNHGVFNAPKEDEKMVGLVFCLLSDFASQKKDFFNFIKDNFKTENDEDYAMFAKTLLVPFKDIISNNFILADEKEETPAELLQIFEEIKITLNQILEVVKNDRKIKKDDKDNLVYILDCAIYCSKYEDMRLIGAMLTAFESLTKKLQSVKFLKQELNNQLLEYYKQNN